MLSHSFSKGFLLIPYISAVNLLLFSFLKSTDPEVIFHIGRPHKQKSHSLRPRYRGGHVTGSPPSIQLSGRLLLEKSRTTSSLYDYSKSANCVRLNSHCPPSHILLDNPFFHSKPAFIRKFAFDKLS